MATIFLINFLLFQGQSYDVKGVLCLYNDQVCGRINGEDIIPDFTTDFCVGKTEGLHADDTKCSKYYECTVDPNEPTIMITTAFSCPQGEYYTVADPDAACAPRLEANPLSTTCDRCEASNKAFVTTNAEVFDCTAYTVCKNNRKSSEGKCFADGESIYFDELTEACVKSVVDNYELKELFACV